MSKWSTTDSKNFYQKLPEMEVSLRRYKDGEEITDIKRYVKVYGSLLIPHILILRLFCIVFEEMEDNDKAINQRQYYV